MRNKFRGLLVLVVIGLIGVGLISAQDGFTAVMISDDPNIPSQAFTMDAWQGLQAFGEANDLEEGENGYHLLPAISEADYFSHFVNATEADHDLIIA